MFLRGVYDDNIPDYGIAVNLKPFFIVTTIYSSLIHVRKTTDIPNGWPNIGVLLRVFSFLFLFSTLVYSKSIKKLIKELSSNLNKHY